MGVKWQGMTSNVNLTKQISLRQKKQQPAKQALPKPKLPADYKTWKTSTDITSMVAHRVPDVMLEMNKYFSPNMYNNLVDEVAVVEDEVIKAVPTSQIRKRKGSKGKGERVISRRLN